MEAAAMKNDLLIRNGRVIDPETQFDTVCDVAVSDGVIAAVGTDLGPARRDIAASGLIFCPGFIDLPPHGQPVVDDPMQAFDGMTTPPQPAARAQSVAPCAELQDRLSRTRNYGTSAS